MKFTKTAVAVAIAGIAVAPVAMADVTLSGQVAIKLDMSDADDVDPVPASPAIATIDPATGELTIVSEAVAATPEVRPGDPTLNGDDSTLNISASHTMNSGLTAYGNYRLDSALTGSTPAGDNVWVGIKGGFGDIRVGEVPDASEYGQVAGDILTDIGGENAGISYTGTFGPVALGLNWSPQNNSDKTAAGIKFSLGGFAIGIGGADIDGDTATSAGASFSFAGASVAVAFKDFDNDQETLGVKVGYGIAGVSLALTYEVFTGDVNEDDAKFRIDAGYGLGGGMDASFRLNSTEPDQGEGVTDYRVMLTKSF